jgi:hypothetical protein
MSIYLAVAGAAIHLYYSILQSVAVPASVGGQKFRFTPAQL